jgi:hypothetical protein
MKISEDVSNELVTDRQGIGDRSIEDEASILADIVR